MLLALFARFGVARAEAGIVTKDILGE